ncbi:alpha-glucuronidase family glycosyl hydrolase [Pedobacter sp. SYP-B3415]|uniref:alpha-d-galacturonidase n=1 Tax=Pedobacter sp. SYP-B3415 TaxID=2496641 RepID=UPI001F0F19CE|nr:alpha-glucuronidase family glycosyl hydrolase [Pedobacter sp. SYP-B3415]
MKYLLTAILICLHLAGKGSLTSSEKNITLVSAKNAGDRVKFGLDKLASGLRAAGYSVQFSNQTSKAYSILVGLAAEPSISASLKGEWAEKARAAGKEGFVLKQTTPATIVVAGADASGALYGCLELAEQIRTAGKLPANLQMTDRPEMVLRGTCIGLQKPDYLPGRDVYEYPYTPESFPWFYDRSLWLRYLDMMVENRYNTLYLWNGHPFSSLVKLKDYPYAIEVDDNTFQMNEEVFRFLTTEAERRGIWVIQMFYNILIPKPFAEKHSLKTQDRNRPIIPLIADYTRKSIAAFVQKYPNVGLMVALGEAMEGVGQDDVDWFTKTIIPGVKDGLAAAGIREEPPIVLRAHDTDAPRVMKAALPIYKNLYTEAKFNGEALTTYTPRGSWAELHRELSSIGTVQIENVHILANLEPFRYGSADFIQKSVQAMHNIYGANGLHLYPQASYWDWPYTADKADKRLLQLDRDWIWYKAWARYAWKANRDRQAEVNFWGARLAEKFGTDLEAGKAILEAYEQAGEIAPKLLRRYGITDGNRQTLTLGMLMTQLINPHRYGLFTLLYESEAPEGEMIIEYAEKEWNKKPHTGETPVQIADEVEMHGKKAVAAIEQARTSVTRNRDEFDRLLNDTRSYHALAKTYAQKVRAALQVLRFKYSNQVADLETAVPLLEQSLEDYKELAGLTTDTYLYANSMQTKQRKIPMRGVDKTFIHWREMVPVFTRELAQLKHSIDSLKKAGPGRRLEVQRLVPARVSWKQPAQIYQLEDGASVFSDTSVAITALAPQLKGLSGIRASSRQQVQAGTELRFSTKTPVKLLVAFFKDKHSLNLAAPQLETDASANNYGESEIKIADAVVAGGPGMANVHTYHFEPGTHRFTLGKGRCILLGFIDGKQEIRPYNAGLAGKGRDIDWLFE